MKWSEQMRVLQSEDEHYNQLMLDTETRDLFINDVEKYYLATRTLTSDNSIYQVLEDGKIYIGNLKEEMKIRPTLHVKPDLKIVSGSGTKDDPYKLG